MARFFLRSPLLVLAPVLVAGFVALPAIARADDSESSDKSDSDKDADKDKEKKEKDEKDRDYSKWAYVADLDLLFLRGNSSVVRGSNADAAALGFNVGTEAWITASWWWINLHFDYDMYIGGGGNGLDGRYQNRILAGLYAPLTKNLGPFIRVGAGGDYRANDSYLSSHLDLPLVQGGVIAVGNGLSFEAGGETGITVGGRFITGDGSRRVLDGLPVAGAFGQLHVWPIILRGSYRQYIQDKNPPAPEEWTARACAAFPLFKEGLAGPIEVCFDGSWMHGGVIQPGLQVANDSHVYYTGISIGLGIAASSTAKESTDRPSDDKTDKKNEDNNNRNEAARASDSAPVASSGGMLDADDMRRLTREALSHFGGSRTMQEWLVQSPRPVAVVLPFGNQLKDPLPQEVLDAARKESETWLLGSQAAVVIDRSTTDRAVTAQGGAAADNAQAIAKAVNARYAVIGWIEPEAKAPEKGRASYSLVVRVLDTTTNAIVWQQNAEITKVRQAR